MMVSTSSHRSYIVPFAPADADSARSGESIVSGSHPKGSNNRTLFHGPFCAGQSLRARDAVCAATDSGARDILYVVANGTARGAVIADLVARKGAVFGVHAVTLRNLPLEIERRARVRGADFAGGVVEDVLVERAVRAAAHGSGSTAGVTGLAAAAAATIAEVERGGGSLASLARALDAVQPITAPGDSARVLLDTWTAIEQIRRPRTRSVSDALRSAIELVHTRNVLGACSLIVFEDLPLSGPLQRELISAIITSATCSIIATSEYAGQITSAPSTRAHDLLRSLTSWDEQSCERADDPICGAGSRIFVSAPDASESQPPPAIRITRLEAAGESGEVRLAARVVLRHLRGAASAHPPRASDILIVARSRRYRELVREIFTDSGIGVRVAGGHTVSDTALGSVLLELLELAVDRRSASRERSLALVRSPLLDVGTRAADRLERQVNTHGYLGLDGWDELALRSIGPRGVNRVNRLKRAISSARTSLDGATSNDEMSRVVRALARELRLAGNAYFARRRLVKRHPDDSLASSLIDSSVREDNQAWEAVERILDHTMPALLEADGSSANQQRRSFGVQWLSLFARALARETFGGERVGTDLVRVTGAAAGDGQPARITIILGLQQKMFPRQPRQDPFLRDSIREQLVHHGIQMAISEDTAEREREYFARAVATATDALYLSYPATDADGKSAVASFFIEDLQRAVGASHPFAVERLGVADVAPAPEDAGSRAELYSAVAHGMWQRLPATVAAEADRAACFTAWNTLLGSGRGVSPVSAGRSAAMHPSFEAAHLARTPYSTLELSASQLKSIHHCTFKHFVEKVLRPSVLDVPQYDALTKGSLVHTAMMQWVKLDGWRRGTEALAELDAWFTAQAATLSPAARESTLAQFSIDADRERLIAFVRGEVQAVETAGAAKPEYNELAFGPRVAEHGARDPASLAATLDLPVTTSLGEKTVKFTGSIDRVDVYGSAGSRFGIALDYKTGATSEFYAKSMHEGSDLQLRLYLLALENLWRIKPAGALYVGFGDGVRRGAVCEEAADRIGPFDPGCVTVMSMSAWHAFVHDETEALIQPLVERLVTLDIVARPYKRNCGFCELGAICRYDPHQTIANA